MASRWRHCADLNGPGIEPRPPALIAMCLTTELTGPGIEAQTYRTDSDVFNN